VLGLLVAGAGLAAHEGHDTARPVYKQVQVGDITYRVGFALQPQVPLVGEEIGFEFQILQLSDPLANPSVGRPLAAGDLHVRVVTSDKAPLRLPDVSPGEKPGTFTARHEFEDSGRYVISARINDWPDRAAAEFPIVVGAGPVLRAAVVIDAIVLLVLGGLAFALWRSRKEGRAEAGLGRGAALVVAGVAVLVLAHVWVSPRVGRLFLPERHLGPVAWDAGLPPVDGTAPVDAPVPAPHTHPEGTPPHSHPDTIRPQKNPGGAPPPSDGKQASDVSTGVPRQAQEIVSSVVAVPGRLVDVVVPMSARVLFGEFTPRLGRAVRRGQTIAMLEHHYILHDAVHLINQRWLFLVRMLETKRASLDAELKAARLHYLYTSAEALIRQAMDITQEVQAADMAAVAARLEHERAAKLLAMHDAQITESELVRRPLTSPIDGTIEAVNFTQGQLKYENDKLFTILDLSRVWIEARFPGQFASRQPPRHMTFISAAFPTLRFDATLARVANTLDPRTGTVSAYFEVPNPDRVLRVGMRLAPQLSTGGVVRAVANRQTDSLSAPTLSLAAMVKAKPEMTADVTAPIWGRLEFAGRRLNVGDHVRKGENLVQVILELPVDERYPMEARAVDIDSERDMAKARRAQAEQQRRHSAGLLKADPEDAFRKREVQLTERIYQAAEEEEALLVRQAGVFKGVMKRRDPKITIVQAPISGVITGIGFRPGELNRTGEFRSLMTIVDTSRVWLEAQVYDHQSAALLRGFAGASFTSPGLPSSRPLDRPIAVSGAVHPETGTLSAIFDVPNPGGTLKIGASAQIFVPRE